VTQAPDTTPSRGETPRPSSGRSVGWWELPVLIPGLAAAAALGGVGWLGHYQAVGAPGGLFQSRGVPIADEFALPAAAGLGLAVVWAASLATCGRLRVLLGIRRSLHLFARGERCTDVLRVSEAGVLAEAWNRLLAWSEGQAEMGAAIALLKSAGTSGAPSSDRAADGLWHGVIIVDEQQIIRYANGAAAVFLRQRRDALPGIDIRRVVSDPVVLESIGAAAQTGSRQKRVLDVGDAKAEAASVLRYSIRGIGQRHDRSVLIVIEDVTQQRIADAVQHAFVAQATHELRTPLTNMRLYLEQLLEDGLSAEERGTALNVINQEITRLDHIVGDMLSIAEVQAGGMSAKRGEVRLEQMFDALRDDYAESARKKGVDLSFQLPPKFPVIQGDRDKIGIVLHNLLGNAVKYTPSGGTVRVTVREEGDRFVTDVTDTGIGISEDDAGRIFERFTRGQDPRALQQTGTGLGLALARDIARMHEGDIILHSELNVGSTFSFWLPIGGQATARAA
jgi:signal transduction histidine kinase